MAPHALAAQLTAEAGKAKGQGYAAFGEGLAGGINRGLATKERKAETAKADARIEQARQDRLSEQATDNARQDRAQKMAAYGANIAALEKLREGALGDLSAGVGDESRVKQIEASIAAAQVHFNNAAGVEIEAQVGSPARATGKT